MEHGITIVPLAPDMLDDYLDFFQNKARVGCNCMHFHWNADLEADFHKHGTRAPDRVVGFVKNGVIQGYFAYCDGEIVGWCNANNKRNYDALRCDVLSGNRTELWNDADFDIRIKSVVCFLIVPMMRGKGVASRLLERVIEDAKREGFACVEGYPLNDSDNEYGNHHGPMRLFRGFGFVEHKRFERDSIVRKHL